MLDKWLLRTWLVSYSAINDGASCFDKGSYCTAFPQALIRAAPALLHNVLVLWVSVKRLSNTLTILELVLLSNLDLLKPHTSCQRTVVAWLSLQIYYNRKVA